MKYYLKNCPTILVFAAWVAGLLLSGGAAVAQSPSTIAPQAVLIDAGNGAVLLDVKGSELVSPASLTKLMTAEIVFQELKEGRLKPDDEFVVSENAWRKGGPRAGSSTMFLLPKSRVKIADLMRGLLVASGNDAAITLAEGISGNEEEFAKRMTLRAHQLGLTQSTFGDAAGWSMPQQKVSMHDMARLARHLISAYPEYYPVFSQRDFTWSRIKQQNRNPLLTMDIGADGLKTGYLQESGYSLVGSAVQNNRRLILAVSGLKSAGERQSEAKKLLEWGFNSFENKTIIETPTHVGEASVFGGNSNWVGLTTRQPVTVPVPRGSTETISARIVYTGPVRAPIEEGAQIAELHIYRGPFKVMDVPLYSETAVKQGNILQRALDSSYELGRSAIVNGYNKIMAKNEIRK